MVALALQRAQPDEYVVLLSGQDYPLTTVQELERHFSATPGKQFMRYFEIDASSAKYAAQINRRHFRDLPFLSSRPITGWRRKLRTAAVLTASGGARLFGPSVTPPGIVPSFGPTHFALQAWYLEALEALVTPQVEKFFKTTFCPEEKFYQSLSASSGIGRATGGPLTSGAEPYVGEGNWRYANLHIIDPSLTRVYTLDDWSEVRDSGKFFLRKVEEGSSDDLLDAIDAHREGGPQT